MSETGRRWNPLILGLILVLLITGISVASGSGGEAQIFQSGTVNTTMPAGSVSALTSITFSPAFATTPNIVTTPVPTVAQLVITYTFTDNIPVVVPTTSVLTWPAMPAAETEFLGLTLHRTDITFRSANKVTVIATVAGAGAAGSFLKAQYFVSANNTWIDVCAPNSDTPKVAIDVTGTIVGTGCIPNPVINTNTQQLVRIAGKNGDGVTSPSFGVITLQLQFGISFAPLTAIFNPTKTGFSIVVMIFTPQTATLTIKVQWTAWLCASGSTNC
jgi:hypothetical protein